MEFMYHIKLGNCSISICNILSYCNNELVSSKRGERLNSLFQEGGALHITENACASVP